MFPCLGSLSGNDVRPISGSKSLRELETGFNSQSSHHYHLGCGEVKRSTLSDANAKRDCQVFKQVCDALISEAHRKVKRETQELLYLLDSTPIILKGFGYDEWTAATADNRIQGLKGHVVIDSTSDVLVFFEVTKPKISDVAMGREVEVVKGATYVFDKGYCDYNWWFSINQNQAQFVTRFKHNASVKIEQQRAIPEESSEMILEDAIVSFKHRRPGGSRINQYYGTHLRRITVHREGHKKPLIIATNDMECCADDIAERYKQRWQIELFFKWLKQNLKIKRYLGRSENAVRIQLYTALITYLLGKKYCQTEGYVGSLKLFFVMLRECLFQRPAIEVELTRKRRRYRADNLAKQRCLAL